MTIDEEIRTDAGASEDVIRAIPLWHNSKDFSKAHQGTTEDEVWTAENPQFTLYSHETGPNGTRDPITFHTAGD